MGVKKILLLLIPLLMAACMRQEPLAETAAPASREGDSSLVPGEAVVLVREEQADGFGLALRALATGACCRALPAVPGLWAALFPFLFLLPALTIKSSTNRITPINSTRP